MDISFTCMKTRLLLLGAALLIASGVSAQMLGVTVEVDTAFYGPNTPTPDDTFDTDGNLNGYVTYRVYADFTNTDDVLSAIYSDVVALNTSPIFIDAPCGCHNPVDGSVAMDGTNPSGFWIGPFADMEYDTYWTIGMESSDAPGMIPQTIGMPAGTTICGGQADNGSIFAPGSPMNAIAGADLRVLIAQVTTCGDWCFNASFQVFVNGDQQQVQLFELPGDVCTDDPCDVYTEQEATVMGNVVQCTGSTADVEVEFLGEGSMDQSTFVLVDQIGNLVAGPQNSTSFSGLTPGTYAMLVADEFTCMDTTVFTVIQPNALSAEFDLAIDNNCFGEGDATVCIVPGSLQGGTGDLTIQCLDPNGVQVASVDMNNECWTNLVCSEGNGDYYFSVSDIAGCVVDTTITVNCPLPIESSITSENIDCQGAANGWISAEATGGSGDIYFHVNSDSLIVPCSFSDLAPGTYVVEIVDEFGCGTGAQQLDITEPDAINLTVLSASPISCGADCNGAVVLEYFGGTGDLSILLTNTLTLEETNSLDSLCASDYTALATDENGCTVDAEFTIDAPAPLEFLISPTPATCTGMCDGSADVFPAGGTGELTWIVEDSLGNTANLNNLCDQLYTCYVTDVLGCTHVDTFSIGVGIVTDMVLTTYVTPVTCWNAVDGTMSVSVEGGNAPFTYLWSDPFSQTAQTATNLTEDTYSVTVTDSIGCNVTAANFVGHIEGCLFIADAVTPNGDGYNDEWIVGGLQDFPGAVVEVYNRYGQLLFRQTDNDVFWDGRYNDNRLPVADYYFVINLSPNDPPITGTISLKY